MFLGTDKVFVLDPNEKRERKLNMEIKVGFNHGKNTTFISLRASWTTTWHMASVYSDLVRARKS